MNKHEQMLKINWVVQFLLKAPRATIFRHSSDSNINFKLIPYLSLTLHCHAIIQFCDKVAYSTHPLSIFSDMYDEYKFYPACCLHFLFPFVFLTSSTFGIVSRYLI